MSRRARAFAVAVVAVAVLAAGVSYAVMRPVTWQSAGSVYLSPASDDAFTSSALLDAFERSGTIGTYVELLASDSLQRRADAGDVDLRTRAVPESRVISLTARGDEERVQPALAALLRAAIAPASRIGDGWELRVGQPPTAPEQAGPSTPMVVLAAVLLAALAGLVAAVTLARLAPQRPGGPPGRGPVHGETARPLANGFARVGR